MIFDILHFWSTPWIVMWLLAVGTFVALKWASLGQSMAGAMAGASCGRRAGYLLGWPGMDARAFLGTRSLILVTYREWITACLRMIAGAMLFWGVARWVPASQQALTGLIGMAGLIVFLHFGLFHLLALVWKSQGVTARPIMDAPWRATSLADFWSRRWNLAFRDIAHQRVFRPLAPKLGATGAMFAVFLVSGIVHDAIISIPVGSGFGQPTAYFLLQGVGCAGQRKFRTNDRTALGRVIQRAWTGLFVLGPVLWLFHPAFLTRVMVPFMRFTGALG